MTVDLRFIHLEVAEETRLMLEDRIETQFQEFEKMRPFKVKVVCSTEAARQDAHGPMFKCHASFHSPWLTRELHVEDTGMDSLYLISACCHTLKAQALKESKRLKSKRHQPSRMRIPEMAVS